MRSILFMTLLCLIPGSAAVAEDIFDQGSHQNASASAVRLKKIEVFAERDQGMATIRKERQQIREEMITDGRDVVRYSTDVGIADNGRHNKGFAIRGVEGNRVGISIDGVSLPDSEENSLYARYGNFNNSRLSIDPELIRSINIERGADSFNSGSGSLGGNVNYHTLNAQDIVLPNNRLGMYLKNAYNSRREEWVHTLGAGFAGQSLDVVALTSRRRGHELKSNGHGADVIGPERGVPDPSAHRYHSYLAKISYRLNWAHQIGYSFHGQNGNNYVDEKSYILIGRLWREADDQHSRQNHNLFYEWLPYSTWLAMLRLDVDKQKTDIASVNYKGSRHFVTDAKELDEIYDRRMKTDFKRVSLRLDSLALELAGGEHQFIFKAALGQRKFENLNHDTYIFKHSTPTVKYTIQHPVTTDTWYLSLLDKVTWNHRLGTRLGIRYDDHRLKPQPLKAACHACDQTIPAVSHFRGVSGLIGVDVALTEQWQLSYDLSSGFRVPTASELYFTFKHAAGNWLANPNLKAERSVNHALSLRGEGALGKFKITVYHNRYRHFLTEQEIVGKERNPYYEDCVYYGGWNCRQYDEKLFMSMVNADKAIINGIDLQGELNLNRISPRADGWVLRGGLGYSHGKLSTGTGMLSIQPLKILAGLGYDRPDGRYGIHAVATYYGRKKAEDAQVVRHHWSWRTRSYVRDVETYPYLNKAATVVDVFGHYKPFKYITLRGGVYNLFNKHYQHWDSLRGINQFSTTNTVDRDGKGLQRFYAPGRNFMLSLEGQF